MRHTVRVRVLSFSVRCPAFLVVFSDEGLPNKVNLISTSIEATKIASCNGVNVVFRE